MELQKMLHEEAIRWEQLALIASESKIYKDCLQKARLFLEAEQIVNTYFSEHAKESHQARHGNCDCLHIVLDVSARAEVDIALARATTKTV